jgi:hypothetical protein
MADVRGPGKIAETDAELETLPFDNLSEGSAGIHCHLSPLLSLF